MSMSLSIDDDSIYYLNFKYQFLKCCIIAKIKVNKERTLSLAIIFHICIQEQIQTREACLHFHAPVAFRRLHKTQPQNLLTDIRSQQTLGVSFVFLSDGHKSTAVTQFHRPEVAHWQGITFKNRLQQ